MPMLCSILEATRRIRGILSMLTCPTETPERNITLGYGEKLGLIMGQYAFNEWNKYTRNTRYIFRAPEIGGASLSREERNADSL